MRRGSVSSWHMQYGGSSTDATPPAEFMTGDEAGTKFSRKGGWFVSYPKAGFFFAIVVLAVILAGFIGAHLVSLPGKRKIDSTALVTDETEDADTIVRASVLQFIEPTRYRLQLTPMLVNNVYATRVSKIKGLVVIEFRVTGKACLSELPLDSRNIRVKRYKLLPLGGEIRTRRRRDIDEEGIETNETGTDTDTSKSTAAVSDGEEILRDSTINGRRDHPNSSMFSSNNEAGVSTLVTNSGAINRMIKTEDLFVEEREYLEIKMKEYVADDEHDFHVIHLESNIGPGNYSLEIEYEVSPDDRATYAGNYNDGTWLLGTKLNPVGARNLLPSFGDARFKSVFSVSVARPKEISVLANMPLRSSRDSWDDLVIDSFDETPPMSTHNLALAIGKIEPLSRVNISEDTEVRVTFWSHDSGMSINDIYIAGKLDACIASLQDTLRTPYPFRKLDIVNLSSGASNNAGSPGLIFLTESLFGVTDRSAPVMKMGALKALIRLLGEQWLGGAVSMSNWTDVWILEGSLLYLRHETMRKIDSSFETSMSYVADIRSPAMSIDSYSVSRPLAINVNPRFMDPTSDEDNRYEKGACLIRMLHGAIGDTAFRNGYQKFITRWKNESAESSAFWNIMDDVSNGLPAGVSLQKIMSPWISQSGFPLLTVTRDYQRGTAIIRQTQFTYDQRSAIPKRLWHIPVAYVGEKGDWNSPTETWMKAEAEKLLDDVAKPGERSWVLFNVNGTGYYRVHYDDQNWKLLSAALDENHELFPPETRASLIDDVFSLAAIGLVEYETAFGLIGYMSATETHYAPWSALMRHMFALNDMMYGTPTFTDFRDFVLNLVSPLHSEVGGNVQEGSQLALIATKMACSFEHSECLDLAEATFAKLKQNVSMADDVDSEYIRETLYCTIARRDSGQAWKYFLAAVKTAVDWEEKRRLLSSFACFQVSWILQSVLEEVLYGDTFSEDDSRAILGGFPKNPTAAQVAFKFVRANWQEIAKRFSASYSTMRSFIIALMGGITTEQDLEDLQLFREVHFDSTKTVRHVAALVEAKGKFVASWLKKSLPEVEKLLKDNSGSQVFW